MAIVPPSPWKLFPPKESKGGYEVRGHLACQRGTIQATLYRNSNDIEATTGDFSGGTAKTLKSKRRYDQKQRWHLEVTGNGEFTASLVPTALPEPILEVLTELEPEEVWERIYEHEAEPSQEG